MMKKVHMFGIVILLICLSGSTEAFDGDRLKISKYQVDGNNHDVHGDTTTEQIEVEFDTSITDEVDACKTVHIAVVCGGFNASREFYVLIKSILFYRSLRIHLHLLVDNVSRLILDNLFKSWKVLDLTISFYNASEVEPEISWIPSQHYSHRYGLMKLVFLTILYERSHLYRVIMMDTDMIVLGDIKQLQMNLEQLDTALGMVENQSDWYLKSDPSKFNRNVWPAVGRGYNSGLILANLIDLHKRNWPQSWRRAAELNLITQHTAPLADQDIINALVREEFDMVSTLAPCLNIQLNDHSNIDRVDLDVNQRNLRVVHWNSPHKRRTKNKLAAHFNTWYSTFLDWNGKLLQQSPCHWPDDSSDISINVSNTTKSDNLDPSCYEIQPQQSEDLRTYLYFRDYEVNADEDNVDVTIVVHLSIDRLQVLDELASHWRGQISAAIYLPEQDTSLLMVSIDESKNLSYRRNIGYHLVFRDRGFNYPINKLRNVALENVNTDYVFIADIDLIPSINLYDHLKSLLSNMPGAMNGSALDGKALVVPVFENLLYKSDFPNSKSDLLTGINLGAITMFRDQIWPQGQSPTDYLRWRAATRPYEVDWKLEYEPFIVVSRNVPRFDERFVGFGWNKVEHTMLLSALGYKFIVLPEAFVMHKFHSPSYDIMRHRESSRYRRCIMQHKRNFVLELYRKFPKFFSKQDNKLQI